jgi:ABC-type antimicrobial peptide transport system permease subunit
MFTLIIVVSLVLAAGVAGFWAGVKHAEKAKALKEVITK